MQSNILTSMYTGNRFKATLYPETIFSLLLEIFLIYIVKEVDDPITILNVLWKSLLLLGKASPA